MANYCLPIYPTTGLYLVFLYEYTGRGILLFYAARFGLWWLNIDQFAFPIRVLIETSSGNRDDSRLDDRGSNCMLSLSILPLYNQLLVRLVCRNSGRISSHNNWNVLAA